MSTVLALCTPLKVVSFSKVDGGRGMIFDSGDSFGRRALAARGIYF